MTNHALMMVAVALALVAFAIWSLTRVPTGFLPTEDQGYMIVVTQLPDGASKERTDAVLDKIQKITQPIPGVEHVVTVSGISILDNRASLANAGVAFIVMKDWDARLKEQGQDQELIQRKINGALQSIPEAFSFAVLPPPIQGVGNVGGFTMQVEIRNGDFDYDLLQSLANTVVADGNAQSGLQRLATTFRAGAPQYSVVRRPDESGGARHYRGPGVLRPGRLCRFELRDAVQQVRPRLPGLYAGGRGQARHRR